MSLYFYDLSGGLNLTQSKTVLGLDNKKVFWTEAENVEIYQNKGIIRQNGNSLLCTIPEKTSIIGLFEVQNSTGHYLLIASASGKLYMLNYSIGGLTCLKSDFSASEKVTFIEFLGGVCVSNGVDEPVFIDFTDNNSVKAMNTTLSDGTKIIGHAITAYNGRLWIACNSTLYYSALGRFDDWQTQNDAGFISDFHSDYSEITALSVYREFLSIYKKNQIYFLSGFSQDDFVITPFANTGILAQGAVINVDNKQYFFNDGIFHLAQVGELGQIVLSSDITTPIKPLVNSFYRKFAKKICIVSYEEKNQIWFFMPRKNSENLNIVWIYDYLNKAWFTRKIPQRITCAAKFNSKPLTASIDGKIFIEDISNTFCGEAIKFSWKSPFFALKSPSKRKVIDKFELLLDDAYDNVFDVFIQKNYDEYTKTDEQKIQTSNPLNLMWDSDLTFWANDSGGHFWARAIDAKERVLISDKNYSVQICVEGSESTQNCCILGLEFDEFDFN